MSNLVNYMKNNNGHIHFQAQHNYDYLATCVMHNGS